MAPFALGLLGAGRWGERYIATINALPGVELRQLYTTHPEKAELVGNPVEVFNDWRRLLTSGCDAVIVATPPHTHVDIVRECLKANKPVLVEKPLCLSVAEAVALEAEVEQARTPVLVGHTQLFNPAYEKLRQVAKERGPVRFIVSHSTGFGPFRSDTPPLWDWCAHDVAWCLDLTSEVPIAEATVGASPDRRAESNPEMVAIRLDFPSQGPAWIVAGCLSPLRGRSLSVQFADSVLLLKDDETGSSLSSYDVPFDARFSLPSTFRLPPASSLPVGGERPLAREVQYFIEALQGGDQERFGLRLAVNVVRALERVQHALTRQSRTAT
jgi:predicted dehydrogenase